MPENVDEQLGRIQTDATDANGAECIGQVKILRNNIPTFVLRNIIFEHIPTFESTIQKQMTPLQLEILLCHYSYFVNTSFTVKSSTNRFRKGRNFCNKSNIRSPIVNSYFLSILRHLSVHIFLTNYAGFLLHDY